MFVCVSYPFDTAYSTSLRMGAQTFQASSWKGTGVQAAGRHTSFPMWWCAAQLERAEREGETAGLVAWNQATHLVFFRWSQGSLPLESLSFETE
jgi:hypothetical protein